MRDWIETAVEAVLPWTCIACGEIQGGPGLCARCWSTMPWIAEPRCACCGAPFEVGPGAASRPLRCTACDADAPVPGATRTALRYDAGSRALILGFKHADRLHAAPVLAAWLARAGSEILAEADLIAPVPLHWSRLAWRRYNQAAVLARLVARRGRGRFAADLLRRRRRTVSQGELTRDGRHRNVAGAFELGRGWRAQVPGRRIVLVDDVVTTGATIDACARVLLAAGALRVDALAIAGVVDAVGRDREAGDREAGDREAGDRKAGDRPATILSSSRS